MTAAERFVSRLLTVRGDKDSKALSPKDEGAKGFIDEDGNNWSGSAIETAIEYLEKEGEEVQRNPFSKGWAIKEGYGKDGKQIQQISSEKGVKDELYEALVADEALPDGQTLQEHDKRHHPKGYHEGDTCKFREKLTTETETDKGDEVDVDRGDGIREQEDNENNARTKKEPTQQVQSTDTTKVYEGLSKKQVKKYKELMDKKHPEFDADLVLTELGKIKDRKVQGDAFSWVMRGAVKLPEDLYKVKQARELATKAKKDPFSYNTPQDCINQLMGEGHRVKEKPITVEELKKNPLMSDYRDEGYGVETFQVEDSREGQALMRKVIDTHWGKDANPWCLLARGGKSDETTPEFWDWVQSHFDNVSDAATDFQKNNLEWQERYEQETGKSPILESHQLENAWGFWNKYNALPKRVAFKDGKLLAFMATDAGGENYIGDEALKTRFPQYVEEYKKHQYWYEGFEGFMRKEHPDEIKGIGDVPEQWWDRQDRPHNGIPLGETEVPNDKLGRKVDMSELINGEITIPKGMKKYIGREGEKGYKAWDDDGRFYEDVGFGKTIREDEIPKREIKRLLGNLWLATLHRGGNFSNGRINAMLDDKLDLVGLMDGDGRPITEGTDDYSKYVDEVADLVSSYRGEDNKKDKTNDIIVLPNGTKIKKVLSYLYTDSNGQLHDEKWSVSREKKLGDGRISKEFSDVLDTLLSGKDVSDEAIMSLPEWKEAMELEKDIEGRLQKEYGVTRTQDINTKARNRFRDSIVEAALSDHITKTVPIEGYDGEVFETNEGLEEGESYDVEKGKKVFIAIGLPAAGKSTTFANPLAKKYKARLCDSDTVKKVLPEFANGYGGNIVHDESTDINERILAGAIDKGDNIVYPILGYKPEKLKKLMQMFKDKGYEVNLCFKDMPANIAKGRLLGRFLQKGRYLPLTCISKAQGKVGDSFEAVKDFADAYIRASSEPDGSNERIIESKGNIL